MTMLPLCYRPIAPSTDTWSPDEDQVSVEGATRNISSLLQNKYWAGGDKDRGGSQNADSKPGVVTNGEDSPFYERDDPLPNFEDSQLVKYHIGGAQDLDPASIYLENIYGGNIVERMRWS